jgi:hypothetical protein
MRWNAVLLILPLLGSPAASSPKAVEITEVGKQPVEADFPSDGHLRMELCSSAVEVHGTESSRVRVSYDSKHGTDRVRIHLGWSGGEGRLEVDDCPTDDFRISIEVPVVTHLHIRMWAGQLEVQGVTGGKDLELHAGQMNVEVGKTDDYAHVDASVVTGEVEAAPFDVSKGGLFRSFERKGSGKYRLHAHVGAGQITLN